MEINLNDIDLENYPDNNDHAVIINFWYGKESDDEFYEMTKDFC